MNKDLLIIKIICEYLKRKKILANKIDNFDSIISFFEYLRDNPKKFNSLYILNYLYHFISKDDVAKRKTSARVFEDLLSILFNGNISDEAKRENQISDVPEFFVNTKDKIAGNRREKIDIVFENGYGCSLKTLMQSNTEINMGSFDKNVLFDGFGVKEMLGERKDGMGSKPQLLKLLTIIETNKKYEIFNKRFSSMVEYIFNDDMILAIKDDIKMYLYFIDSITLIDTLKSKNKDEFISIVNRWEGNSIRIDRKPLLKNSKCIVLDFSIIDSTIMTLINEFDIALHTSFVEFVNMDNNTKIKQNIFNKLDYIFEQFDIAIKELK